MVKRIQISSFGKPEVMDLVEDQMKTPAADEIIVRHAAIGLNYIDTYHRSGLYPIELPSGLGMEAAGEVVECGASVTDFSAGDRVAYCSGPIGAYAEAHVIKADRAIPLPSAVSPDLAAASMLKGLTAQYLIRKIYPVAEGEIVLFHAIAGGVGQIACQWLKHLGATVIGTVGSEEKEGIARGLGCDHIIRYDREDVAARVKQITKGEKTPVVFDGVGASTWQASLDCLRKRGLMVSFGNASGPVTGVDLGVLASKGSLFVTRPTLFDYTADRADLLESANDLFDVLGSGAVKVQIGAEYPLAEAIQAHKDLEARKTTGSSILRP